MSCYITYNNKNYTEKDFKEYLKSVLAEKQTEPASTKSPGFVEASEIYNKLGNKTVSKNVKIVQTYQQAGVNYAIKNNAIFSLRVNGSEQHFGNPFSPVKAEIDKGLTAVSTTKEAVERYIAWVINSNQPRAEWIRKQLKSGGLKGKDIIYYKELGEPSHATALDYLINEYNWEKISVISNNTPYYEGDITPDVDTIFVFGSNPEGRHGAGAAKIARNKFGAIYGQGEGLQGNAYALPTKDLRIKENNGFKSISPSEITESIKKLYQTAISNPTKQFKVAYRNTTTTSLNGYTGLEMIEMFKQAGPIPYNIVFSKEWYDVISKETSSQVGQIPAPKQPTVFTPEMIRARVKSSFDANGYMDIKETSRGDKVILGAITKYIMATRGIVTNNQILEANKTFKLKEEVTIETIKEGVLRIKIKENLLEGDGDVGLFGGLDMSKLTSSGESMANNVLSNIEQAFKCK